MHPLLPPLLHERDGRFGEEAGGFQVDVEYLVPGVFWGVEDLLREERFDQLAEITN